MLTWSERIPSALWSLAGGTGRRCHLLSPGQLWYVLCLLAPVYLMEDVLVAGLACYSSLVSNFVPKQCLLKGLSDSFVLRLVDGQTVLLTTGFLDRVSLVLFFCPRVRKGAEQSPVFPFYLMCSSLQGELAAFTTATFLQRSPACVRVCASSPVSSG